MLQIKKKAKKKHNTTSGILELKRESEMEKMHIVDLSEKMPSCTCMYGLEKKVMPCKHMCFIFAFVNE